MNETKTKPANQSSGSARNACKTIDEFESRFFPVWYEKQRSGLNPAEADSFGESLARFSVEKHLKDRARVRRK